MDFQYIKTITAACFKTSLCVQISTEACAKKYGEKYEMIEVDVYIEKSSGGDEKYAFFEKGQEAFWAAQLMVAYLAQKNIRCSLGLRKNAKKQLKELGVIN